MITILIIIKNKYHFIQLGTNIDTQYDYQKIQSKKNHSSCTAHWYAISTYLNYNNSLIIMHHLKQHNGTHLTVISIIKVPTFWLLGHL